MYSDFQSHLQTELSDIREAGVYKNERVIVSPQGALIRVGDGKEVLNFCANNYLGLSNNPELISAAKNALDTHGYGVSSVRFICGTQDLHKQLEAAIKREELLIKQAELMLKREQLHMGITPIEVA